VSVGFLEWSCRLTGCPSLGNGKVKHVLTKRKFRSASSVRSISMSCVVPVPIFWDRVFLVWFAFLSSASFRSFFSCWVSLQFRSSARHFVRSFRVGFLCSFVHQRVISFVLFVLGFFAVSFISASFRSFFSCWVSLLFLLLLWTGQWTSGRSQPSAQTHKPKEQKEKKKKNARVFFGTVAVFGFFLDHPRHKPVDPSD